MQTKSPWSDAEFLKSIHVVPLVPVEDDEEDNHLRGLRIALLIEFACCVAFFGFAALFMEIWAAL